MIERLWKKTIRSRGLTLWKIPAVCLWLSSLVYRFGYLLTAASARTTVKVDVPVIAVGNITVGGTGKTPIVDFIAHYLLADGFRVGIVSSGWGRRSRASFVEPGYRVQKLDARLTGDEVQVLAQSQPEAVFSVDRSKTAAAQRLIEREEVDVLIIDDGFQHWNLHRDIDLVTYDGALRSRYLKPFPHGLLREPMSALKRADVIVITRSNLCRDLRGLQRRLRYRFPQATLYHAQFGINELIGHDQRLPVKYLEDKAVFLFAGVGNFRPLHKQVLALAGDLDYALELADHQRYDRRTLENIRDLAARHDSDVLVTTAKDWVKLGAFDFGREIYYLSLTIDLDPGEERLVSELKEKLGLPERGA